MDFLYLSEEDMVAVGVKDMKRCISSIEYTFRLLHSGDYRMGGANNSSHGLRVMFPEKSDIADMPLAAPGKWFTAMPAYLGGKYHVMGIKTYGANQDNFKKSLPRSILMMSLMDVDTGLPLAYMSANILSAMRTGAVSGIFAKHFAKKQAKKIAVIGPGTMARYSLDGIVCARPEIEEISVFGRGQANKDKFRMHCNSYTFKTYKDCRSISEACEDADIILTANTQAENFEDYPLISGSCIKRGACIIVVSAVRMERNYLSEKSGNCTFVADDVRMYSINRGIDAKPKTEEGKKTVTVKEAIHENLSENIPVLNLPEIVGDNDFHRNDEKTYICASGGIPIEDVAWGYECYKNAIKTGTGVKLLLWDESLL